MFNANYTKLIFDMSRCQPNRTLISKIVKELIGWQPKAAIAIYSNFNELLTEKQHQKPLQKSSVIQKISVTLSSVIIAIIVCKLLIFNTLRLQQFFANHHFSGTYISSNSR